MTAPLLRVRLVLPELAEAAQRAVQAAYDMRAAVTWLRSRRCGRGRSGPLAA
ncbi:hypothetical protein [Streptomyces griseus]|uniref:hypothetical protein n=1 Tax=Streptomyces griseus TaxID=1911 RepID=UPI0038221369